MHFVKNTIKKKAKFNIKYLDIIKFSQKCYVPIRFVTSKEDSFIGFHHVENLFQASKSTKKEIIFIHGDHNATRDKTFLKDTAAFFREAFSRNFKIADFNSIREEIRVFIINCSFLILFYLFLYKI